MRPVNVAPHNPQSPVVVGALGGSGTRLIAQILIKLGYFLGEEIDNQVDTLTYTRIFQRPSWLKSCADNELNRHIGLFDRFMRGERWSLADLRLYLKALFSDATITGNRRREIMRALRHFIAKSVRHYEYWGWKEPISHLILEELATFYPRMKYIHVVRHGLDMAYSRNDQQLRYWGDRYGLQYDADPERLPGLQLEYWIRMNQRAVEIGERVLGDRFYFLNYDDICAEPERVIPEFLEFLGHEIEPSMLEQLITMPQGRTVGKYKSRDSSVFTRDQLQSVQDFGFNFQL